LHSSSSCKLVAAAVSAEVGDPVGASVVGAEVGDAVGASVVSAEIGDADVGAEVGDAVGAAVVVGNGSVAAENKVADSTPSEWRWRWHTYSVSGDKPSTMMSFLLGTFL
jgi:hypothetical protein